MQRYICEENLALMKFISHKRIFQNKIQMYVQVLFKLIIHSRKIILDMFFKYHLF